MKIALGIIFTAIAALYFFATLENSDARQLRQAIRLTIQNQKNHINARDVFKGDWDTICALQAEALYPGNVGELANHIDKQYHNLVPDTLSYMYNYNIMLIKNRKPVTVMRMKSAEIHQNNNKYLFGVEGDANCYKRSNAYFKIGKPKNINKKFLPILLSAE